MALVAQGHQLALVWHAADPDSAGCQHLHFSVYNVVEQQKVTLSDCRGVAMLAHTVVVGEPPVSPSDLLAESPVHTTQQLQPQLWNPACNPETQARPRGVSTVYCAVQVTEGYLPVSNTATLAWLGFSDEGLLAAWDSEVRLALLSCTAAVLHKEVHLLLPGCASAGKFCRQVVYGISKCAGCFLAVFQRLAVWYSTVCWLL